MENLLSRRRLLMSMADAGSPNITRYETPYKFAKLVLTAGPAPEAFDSRSVDCPFVFHHKGEFYMTYVGFDGSGYQTGLASSRDLISWRKLGCILKRDPSSPITRYNVALDWILRDSPLHSSVLSVIIIDNRPPL